MVQFGRPGLAHLVDQQSRPFQIGVSRSVDERQMELAAAFGHLPCDVRCGQQVRFAQIPGFDDRGSLESIDSFYLGAEAAFAAVHFDLDNGVGQAISPCSGPSHTGMNPRGSLQRDNGSVQYALFLGCHGHTPRAGLKQPLFTT